MSSGRSFGATLPRRSCWRPSRLLVWLQLLQRSALVHSPSSRALRMPTLRCCCAVAVQLAAEAHSNDRRALLRRCGGRYKALGDALVRPTEHILYIAHLALLRIHRDARDPAHASGAIDARPAAALHLHHRADAPPGLRRCLHSKEVRDVRNSRIQLFCAPGGEERVTEVPRRHAALRVPPCDARTRRVRGTSRRKWRSFRRFAFRTRKAAILTVLWEFETRFHWIRGNTQLDIDRSACQKSSHDF
eukprot:scaffold2679_cov251-Pinguiococcus_pyrenoidosus.AAC.24